MQLEQGGSSRRCVTILLIMLMMLASISSRNKNHTDQITWEGLTTAWGLFGPIVGILQKSVTAKQSKLNIQLYETTMKIIELGNLLLLLDGLAGSDKPLCLWRWHAAVGFALEAHKVIDSILSCLSQNLSRPRLNH